MRRSGLHWTSSIAVLLLCIGGSSVAYAQYSIDGQPRPAVEVDPSYQNNGGVQNLPEMLLRDYRQRPPILSSPHTVVPPGPYSDSSAAPYYGDDNELLNAEDGEAAPRLHKHRPPQKHSTPPAKPQPSKKAVAKTSPPVVAPQTDSAPAGKTVTPLPPVPRLPSLTPVPPLVPASPPLASAAPPEELNAPPKPFIGQPPTVVPPAAPPVPLAKTPIPPPIPKETSEGLEEKRAPSTPPKAAPSPFESPRAEAPVKPVEPVEPLAPVKPAAKPGETAKPAPVAPVKPLVEPLKSAQTALPDLPPPPARPAEKPRKGEKADKAFDPFAPPEPKAAIEPKAAATNAMPDTPPPPAPNNNSGSGKSALPPPPEPFKTDAPSAPPPPVNSMPVVPSPRPFANRTPVAVGDAAPTEVIVAPTGLSGSATVPFEKDIATLNQAGREALTSLAAKLNADPSLQVLMLAYAEGDEDNAARARRLSLNRALAVRAFLMDQGIRSARIDVRALGNKIPEGGPRDRVDLLLQRR